MANGFLHSSKAVGIQTSVLGWDFKGLPFSRSKIDSLALTVSMNWGLPSSLSLSTAASTFAFANSVALLPLLMAILAPLLVPVRLLPT
jgi:hypothetical protein